MILKGGIIITNDEANNFYHDKAIYIKDDTIEKIDGFEKLKDENPNEEVVDLGDKLIMPGLICAHSHSYSAYARGMSVSKATDNFYNLLENQWWALDKNLTHEDVRLNALTTFMESIQNGVTSIIDHHAGPNSVEGSLDEIARASRDLGIRASLCYEVSDRDGKEIRDKGIAENVNFIKKTSKEDDMVKALFGLHAAFTLSDESLDLIKEASKDLDCGYHVHIAEGIEDEWDSLSKHGQRVCQRLEKYDIFNDKTLAIHNVHISDLEMDIIKHHGSMAVFNPESNMNNAVGFSPVTKLLDKGIIVGLGTDAYTNDMFESMKVSNILISHGLHDPTKGFKETLAFQFKNNPKIMSRYLKKDVGIIKEGAYADIIALDYKPYTPMDETNWGGHVLFGLTGRLTTDTMVNGIFIMKDRQIQTINQDEIFEQSKIRASEIWPRL